MKNLLTLAVIAALFTATPALADQVETFVLKCTPEKAGKPLIVTIQDTITKTEIIRVADWGRNVNTPLDMHSSAPNDNGVLEVVDMFSKSDAQGNMIGESLVIVTNHKTREITYGANKTTANGDVVNLSRGDCKQTDYQGAR
ncbi:hypothetical protein HT819_003912 [Salmonella enterica]|nr:hypothetical protein [Salmonella enterica]